MFLADAGTQAALNYGEAIDKIVPGLPREVPMTGTVLEWVNALSMAARTYAITDAQRRLLNIQVDRAQQGLEPLDSSQYGVGVNVGVAADTRTMMIVLGGVAALALVLATRRGR